MLIKIELNDDARDILKRLTTEIAAANLRSHNEEVNYEAKDQAEGFALALRSLIENSDVSRPFEQMRIEAEALIERMRMKADSSRA